MTDILRRSFLADTNILVYALDEDSPFYSRVFELLDWAEKEQGSVYVTHQNILELVNVLVKDYKLKRSLALTKAKSLVAKEPFRTICPLPTTIEVFYKIAKGKEAEHFDLYLAATALDNGVDCVVTNDPKGFKGIEGLEVFSLKEIEKIAREYK